MNGEQHVGRLGLPVGGPLVVSALELHVVPAHPRAAMTERRHRHHPAADAGDRRPQPVDEGEVAEMIGRELRLPPRPDTGLGARHDPGVGDQQIDAPTRRQEPFGERRRHCRDRPDRARRSPHRRHQPTLRQPPRGGEPAPRHGRRRRPGRVSSPTQCPSSRQSPPPADQSNRCLRARRRPSSRHRIRNRRGVARKARCHGTGPRTPRRTQRVRCASSRRRIPDLPSPPNWLASPRLAPYVAPTRRRNRAGAERRIHRRCDVVGNRCR